MKRTFTKYPNSYVKASLDRSRISDDEANEVETKVKQLLQDTDYDLQGIIWYMAGNMPNLPLREFIDILNKIYHVDGIDIPGWDKE